MKIPALPQVEFDDFPTDQVSYLKNTKSEEKLLNYFDFAEYKSVHFHTAETKHSGFITIASKCATILHGGHL